MEPSAIFGAAAIGLVIWIVILFVVIKDAVKSATKGHVDALTTQNRLLIKLLEKQGVSKDEIIDLHEQDVNAFWDSIKENKPAT